MHKNNKNRAKKGSEQRLDSKGASIDRTKTKQRNKTIEMAEEMRQQGGQAGGQAFVLNFNNLIKFTSFLGL